MLRIFCKWRSTNTGRFVTQHWEPLVIRDLALKWLDATTYPQGQLKGTCKNRCLQRWGRNRVSLGEWKRWECLWTLGTVRKLNMSLLIMPYSTICIYSLESQRHRPKVWSGRLTVALIMMHPKMETADSWARNAIDTWAKALHRIQWDVHYSIYMKLAYCITSLTWN